MSASSMHNTMPCLRRLFTMQVYAGVCTVCCISLRASCDRQRQSRAEQSSWFVPSGRHEVQEFLLRPHVCNNKLSVLDEVTHNLAKE